MLSDINEKTLPGNINKEIIFAAFSVTNGYIVLIEGFVLVPFVMTL